MDSFSVDYETLKSAVASLEKDLENNNQLIYDAKKQIAVATALEQDYLQEIDALKSQDSAEVTELQRQVKELENNIASWKQSCSSDLLQKSSLIESLKSEIKEVTKSAPKKEDNETRLWETSKNTERNCKLRDEIMVLNTTLKDIQNRIDEVQMQNSKLDESNKEIVMELDQMKENLKTKVEELVQTKNNIQSLQEDSFLINLELESVKSKPMDPDKKGNSLFGEVEDSRIKTEQSIQQIRKKHAQLQANVHNKLKQMTALRSQNTQLCHQLTVSKISNVEYEQVIELYKAKVSALESAIEELKEELLKEKKIPGRELASYCVDFVNDALKTKRKEGINLRDELNSESKRKLETFTNLMDANKEMRNWRRKALRLKIRIEKLESTILEMEFLGTPVNIADLETSSDILVNSPEANPDEGIYDKMLKNPMVEIRKKRLTEANDPNEHNKSSPFKREPNVEMNKSNSLDLEEKPFTALIQNNLEMLSDARNEQNTEINVTEDKILNSNSIITEVKAESSTSEIVNHESIKTEESINEGDEVKENLLKSYCRNDSAEPILQNNSLKLEFDQNEQSKLLDNLSGSGILNSTSFETKVESFDPNPDLSCIQKVLDESVIIVDDTSGIQLVDLTSEETSPPPFKLEMRNSCTSNLKVKSRLLFNKVDSDTDSDVVVMTEDVLQPLPEIFDLTDLNSTASPTPTPEYNYKDETRSEETFSNDSVCTNSKYRKAYISNAGHTPAHQKFKSKVDSVTKLSKAILQMNICKDGPTPVSVKKSVGSAKK